MIANWLPRSKRLAFIGGISGWGVKPSQRATWVAWSPSFSSAVSGRMAVSPPESRRTNSGAVRPRGHTAPVPVITPWEDIAGRSERGAAQHDDGAVAAEGEGVGDRNLDVRFARFVGDV